MKHHTMILGTVALLAAGTMALNADNLGSYLMSKPQKLVVPQITDTVDAQGKKYDRTRLLDTKTRLDIQKLSPTLVSADTAGRIQLPVAEGDNSLAMTVLETRIRAPKYSKGSLKVTSPAMFEVWVNDEPVNKKGTLEDSISAGSLLSVPLELIPHRTYTLKFRVLTPNAEGEKPTFKAEYAPDADYKDVAVAVDPELKPHFEIDNTVNGERVSGVSLSPDGKYLLVKYSERQNSKYTRQWAVLKETASGKTVSSGINPAARWMPRSNKLYWPVKLDKGYDIMGLEVPTLKQATLIKDIPSQGITWSPNEQYVLYYNEVEGTPESGVMRRVKSPDDRMPGDRDRSYIQKYDIATGITSPLVFSANSTMLLDISRSGDKVLYVTYDQDPTKYPFYFSDIISVDANTLKADTLLAREVEVKGALYSPDEKQIFVWAGPDFAGGVGLVQEGLMPNNYDIQGFVYDIASKEARPATKYFNPSIKNVTCWNKADGQIYFTGEAGFGVNAYKLNPKTMQISQIPTKPEYVRAFSVGSDESQWAAYTGMGFNYDGAAWLCNLKNATTVTIDDPLEPTLDNIDWASEQTWTFTASDGTEIDGRCFLPPNFDPQKKYPLIVYYYGGCVPTVAGMYSPYSPQLFASWDYVVYVLNPSGSTGYGQEFSARHVNAWGKRTADDIIEGVEQFCKEHPFINKEKIGCIGASYGGFMTQYLQTLTDMFACAVSHAGISNVTSYWGEGYWGYSYSTVAASKSYPWNNPDLYTKQGSLFNADKIHTPLLLLHGSVDTNVPIGESIQLFNALKILGRDVEFITVDGEDHIITDYEKRKLWHATIMAWFAKYLQDDPAWWNALYGNK